MREIVQGICMTLFFASFLLVEVSCIATFICIVVFGGLALAFDKGII